MVAANHNAVPTVMVSTPLVSMGSTGATRTVDIDEPTDPDSIGASGAGLIRELGDSGGGDSDRSSWPRRREPVARVRCESAW